MSEWRPWKRRLSKVWPELALAIAVLYACPRLSRTSVGPITSEDEAAYLLLARSLHDGGGYVSSWLPGSPPHALFPPGFPLYLDLMWTRASATVREAQKATEIVSFLSLAAAYLLQRRLLGRGGALACTAVFACSPLFWRFSGAILSEPLSLLLVLCALSNGELWRERKGFPLWSILASLFAVAALFVRMANAPLLLALPIAALWPGGGVPRGHRGGLVFLLACMLGGGLLAWHSHTRDAVPEERGGYANALLARDLRDLDQPRASAADLLRRLGGSAGWYAVEFTDEAFHHFGKLGPLAWPARAIALGLMAAGGFRLFRRGRVLTAAWAAGYILLILLHPAFEGGRFVYPILPLLLGFLWEGLRWVGRERWGEALAVGAALLMCASALRVSFALANVAPSGDVPMARYLDAARWIQHSSSAGGVVLCRKPCILAQETGLKARCYPFTRDLTAQVVRIRESGANWILVDELSEETPKFLEPALDRLPWKLSLAYVVGKTRVYRIEGR